MKTWIPVLLLLLTLPVTARAAEETEVRIPVTVLAEGSTADPEAVYTVELIPQTPGCPMPAGSEPGCCRMKLSPGQTGHFRIPCLQLGVYDYRIQQLPGQGPCIYDCSVLKLRLFVTAEDSGKTAVTALIYGQEGTKEPAALFRNRWPEPVSVTLTALKTLDGKTPADGAFSFRLLAEDGTLLQETKNRGRHIAFDPLLFQEEGTFRFFLKETAGSDGKILYDRTVYTVQVDVTLAEDYRAEVTLLRNGKPFSGTPAFANYTDTGSPKTGDTIGSWVTVLAVSSAGLLTLRKKRRA